MYSNGVPGDCLLTITVFFLNFTKTDNQRWIKIEKKCSGGKPRENEVRIVSDVKTHPLGV